MAHAGCTRLDSSIPCGLEVPAWQIPACNHTIACLWRAGVGVKMSKTTHRHPLMGTLREDSEFDLEYKYDHMRHRSAPMPTRLMIMHIKT
jgi:hypothetical protein